MKHHTCARVLLVSGIVLAAAISGCSLTEVRTPVNSAEASETKGMPSSEPNYLRHTAKDITGKEVALETFRGDVLLVVNTASNCGFTRQYKGLQELHSRYEKQGLRVLGFPCNDFGGQEPGSHEQIAEFCSSKYDVEFPLFEKVRVKSTPKHPLYKDLTENAPEGIRGEVSWNFTKFLIGRDGNVVARFGSAVSPTGDSLIAKVEEALAVKR